MLQQEKRLLTNMKKLVEIIEGFFDNVGARPMTLREFMINLIGSETNTVYKFDKNHTDDKLVSDLLDWMLDDDFDRSRKIKGVNLHEFLVKNIDKPILISVDASYEASKSKSHHLSGRYVYNLNVDGEEFTWIRFKLYPWIPNNPKKR